MTETESLEPIADPLDQPRPFADRRAAAGLSLEDAAREFGVSLATIAEWDHGAETPPSHVLRSLEMIGRFCAESRETAAFQAPQSSTALMPTPKAAPNPMSASSDLIKSKKRVTDHGEVFTPPWLVEKMLDLVKGETERIDSRFLEPACGSGNFLVPILQRKLAAVEARYGKIEFEKRHYALVALASLYGIELLADNIAECQANMLDIFAQYLGLAEEDDLYRTASHFLSTNLIHGDAMTMKDSDGGPITVVEWSYIGKGKFNRRDFRLDVLTEMSSLRDEHSLFAGLGNHEIFKPTKSYPPMTVRELAALAQGEAQI
jgi:transcriptional regulator with XRE-family HTH domain